VSSFEVISEITDIETIAIGAAIRTWRDFVKYTALDGGAK
jgi:hypothetical protein